MLLVMGVHKSLTVSHSRRAGARSAAWGRFLGWNGAGGGGVSAKPKLEADWSSWMLEAGAVG